MNTTHQRNSVRQVHIKILINLFDNKAFNLHISYKNIKYVWRWASEKSDLDWLKAITEDTYTTKIFVKKFNISVDNLQSQQLIVFWFNCTTKIQTGISVKSKQQQNITVYINVVSICWCCFFTIRAIISLYAHATWIYSILCSVAIHEI